MHRWAWLVLVGGCCDPTVEQCDVNDTDRKLVEAQDCPKDYSPASSSSMVFYNFSYTGGLSQPNYFHGRVYDGYGAAGCIRDDGLGGRWIFEVNSNEPWAALTVEADATGSHDLFGNDALIEIDLLSDSTLPTYRNGQNFQQGVWWVNDLGATVTTELNASAAQDNVLLTLNVTAELKK